LTFKAARQHFDDGPHLKGTSYHPGGNMAKIDMETLIPAAGSQVTS
jgi:hypothetical protein